MFLFHYSEFLMMLRKRMKFLKVILYIIVILKCLNALWPGTVEQIHTKLTETDFPTKQLQQNYHIDMFQ